MSIDLSSLLFPFVCTRDARCGILVNFYFFISKLNFFCLLRDDQAFPWNSSSLWTSSKSVGKRLQDEYGYVHALVVLCYVNPRNKICSALIWSCTWYVGSRVRLVILPTLTSIVGYSGLSVNPLPTHALPHTRAGSRDFSWEGVKISNLPKKNSWGFKNHFGQKWSYFGKIGNFGTKFAIRTRYSWKVLIWGGWVRFSSRGRGDDDGGRCFYAAGRNFCWGA